METINNQFLGRGWSFPPTFSPSMGGVVMTEGIDDIYGSLHVLLTTIIGERIMQPRYGCSLHELLFENIDTTFQTYIIDKIETSILYFEPRIRVEQIIFQLDPIGEGRIFLQVDFTVKSTNSRYNFVFPFYKKEGTEILELLTSTPQIDNAL